MYEGYFEVRVRMDGSEANPRGLRVQVREEGLHQDNGSGMEKGMAPKATWEVEGLKSMAGKKSWLNLKDDKVMKDDLKMTLV